MIKILKSTWEKQMCKDEQENSGKKREISSMSH